MPACELQGPRCAVAVRTAARAASRGMSMEVIVVRRGGVELAGVFEPGKAGAGDAAARCDAAVP